MSDMMNFPETWEEFAKQYAFVDREQIYTNGAGLIAVFRVEQWLEHLSETKITRGQEEQEEEEEEEEEENDD